MSNRKTRKYLKVVWKIIKIIFLVLAGLFLILAISLQLPVIKNNIVKFAINKIKEKVDTEISIGSVDIILPNAVTIRELYIEDHSRDTLFYAGRIFGRIGLPELFSGNINISRFSIDEATAKINRAEGDSLFNFNFLIEAFSNPDKPKEPKEDTTGTNFSISRIELRDIRFIYDDKYSGNYVEAGIGDFVTVFAGFDLNKMIIDVRRIGLMDSYAILDLSPSISEQETEKSALGIFLRRSIRIKDVDFSLKMPGSNIDIYHANLRINSEEVNTLNNKIQLRNILLSDTEIWYQKTPINDSVKIASGKADTEESSFDWIIGSTAISMRNNTLAYLDLTKGDSGEPQVFSDLQLTKLNADISNLMMKENFYTATISKFSTKGNHGLDIKELNAKVNIGTNQAMLDNFSLVLNNTSIYNNTEIHYSSLSEISENPGDIEFTTDFSRTTISTSDAGIFVPSLAEKFRILGGDKGVIYLETAMHGKVSELVIDNILMHNDQDLIVRLSGDIKGLPDVKTARYDLKIDSLSLRSYQIESFLPDTALPENMQIPEDIFMKAAFTGTFNRFTANFNMQSSQGDISSDVIFSSVNDQEKYSGNLNINNYNIGKLLQNEESLGELKLVGNFSGSSRKFKEIDAGFNFHIDKVDANKYSFRNIDIEGDFANKLFTGNVNIDDENLVADFRGKASLGDSIPVFDFTLFLDGADLSKLKLSKDDIRLQGTLVADFRGKTLSDFNGELVARDFIIVKNDETFRIDSINAVAVNSLGSSMLQLNAPFLELNYEGTVSLDKLDDLIRHNIDHHFTLKEEDHIHITETGSFTFTADIHDTEILSNLLLPDLDNFLPASIDAEYDGTSASFEMSALFPRINYKGNILDTLLIEADSDNDVLNFNLVFNHLMANPFETGKTSFAATAASDSIKWQFVNRSTLDDDSINYFVSGQIQSSEGAYRLNIINEGLLINALSFNIPADNYISFEEEGTLVNNFILSSGDQQLEISKGNKESQQSDKLAFDFSNFSINNLTALIEANQEIFEGFLDGRFELSGKDDPGNFYSDLDINEFKLFGEDVFQKISLNADDRTQDIINLNMIFLGENSNMNLIGKLEKSGEETLIDANLDIKALDLANLASFFPDQINKLSGILSGKVNVGKSISDLAINGNMKFNSVVVNPTFINIDLKLENEEIKIDNRSLIFDNFRIEDPAGKIASLSGKIDASESGNILLDMTLDADEFQLLNTTGGKNRMFYGDVRAGLDVRVNGTTQNPEIYMDISLGNDSEFFFIVPEAGSATIEREGLVEFIVKDTTDILTRDGSASAETEEFTNISLDANITVDKSAILTIVIDPTTDERLQISGDGNLSFSMKNSGQMSLAGRYEVSEGDYNLKLFDVIKRDFIIQKGSSLTWTGELTNPELNLNTYYQVRTSPEPLIVSQTAGGSESIESYDNLYFNVFMRIKGFLLQPELSFDIQMPEDQRDAMIEARLARLNQNESEVNKQVFSLLLLNSFLAESSSSDNSLATEINSTARKGIGNMLSQQLNRFSDRYIKGFKLNVDIDSYAPDETREGTGRTNVQADVSKELFNERLTVRLGGSADIRQGSQSGESSANMNNIAGDVEVEYKLTADGIYRLLGFRKTEYEDIFDGELKRTGIAVIFNKDFYKFRNLFKKRENTEKEKENITSE